MAHCPERLPRRGVGEIGDLETEGDGDRRCRWDELRADAFREQDDGGGPARWRKREEETDGQNTNSFRRCEGWQTKLGRRRFHAARRRKFGGRVSIRLSEKDMGREFQRSLDGAPLAEKFGK